MTKSNKLNEYHEILKSEYKKISDKSPFVVHNEYLSYETVENVVRRNKRKIVGMETLPSHITHFTNSIEVVKKRLKITERTGLLKITFKNGDGIIVLKYPVFQGKRYDISTMYCSSMDTIKEFIQMISDNSFLMQKPKVGIFTAYFNPNSGSTNYVKFKNPPTLSVIHERKTDLMRCVDDYFDNLALYSRYGKTGGYRMLVYGKEGTGKTSMAYEIAKKHSKDKCIIFSTDPRAIISHTSLCAKYNLPTIVIAEECDKWLGGIDDKNRPNSEIKAYMDGHMANKNKGGELFVLITNYPKTIENTILLRPGRIHKRIEIGPSKGEFNIEIAKLYFIDEKGELICKESDLSVLKEMMLTGSQIERIAQLCLNYVIGTNSRIDKSTISTIISQYNEELQNLKNYKTSDTIDLLNRQNTPSGSLGFAIPDVVDSGG